MLALFALINLLLVFFNLSYLPLRDTYLRYTPLLVKLYNPVKGIEPHPDAEAYLQTVEQTVRSISKKGLEAFPTKQLLTSLERQSIFLIEENPFLAANKSSTFAKLKHRMEYRLQTRSAKEAFTRFWSQEYLLQNDTATQLAFFADKIEPLLKINYYRRINANGLYIDYFWRIDLFFVIFFAFEYLARTFWIAKHTIYIRFIVGNSRRNKIYFTRWINKFSLTNVQSTGFISRSIIAKSSIGDVC